MATLERKNQLVGLAGWVIVSFIAAALGAAASIQAGSFYAQLVRPDWAPPASVFGPVWTALYALMGIAAWLVWREGGFRAAGSALVLFLVQLALNALWSWLFFGWHRGAQAFADILLLWALILATLVAFWRIRPLAGVLLLPYLLWVSFAAVLNYSVWQLNPEILGQDSSYSVFHAQPVSALIRSVDEKNIAAILGIDYSTFIHIPS
jgi:tryptophan-rich sensory protein